MTKETKIKKSIILNQDYEESIKEMARKERRTFSNMVEILIIEGMKKRENDEINS